jgi:hypothetical protein
LNVFISQGKYKVNYRWDGIEKKAKNVKEFLCLSRSHPRSLGAFLSNGGKVNDVPNVNDMDQHMLIGGKNLHALFVNRIANLRCISGCDFAIIRLIN